MIFPIPYLVEVAILEICACICAAPSATENIAYLSQLQLSLYSLHLEDSFSVIGLFIINIFIIANGAIFSSIGLVP